MPKNTKNPSVKKPPKKSSPKKKAVQKTASKNAPKTKGLGKIILSIIVTALIVGGGGYLLYLMQPEPEPIIVTKTEKISYPLTTPKDIAENYYTWHINYDGDLYAKEAYKDSPYLTDGFKKNLEALLKTFTEDQLSYDPMICGQTMPEELTLDEPIISDKNATVIATAEFPEIKNAFKISFVLSKNSWLINSVTCLDEIQETQPEMSQIKLYYGNSRLNPSEFECNKVYAVTREVEKSEKSALNALRLLFAGPTAAEEINGYNSFFSSETANILQNFAIKDKSAYLNFTDIREILPNANSSCGRGQFFAEIETTLRDISEAENFFYAIEGNPRTFYEWMQIGCVRSNNFCDDKPFEDMIAEPTETTPEKNPEEDISENDKTAESGDDSVIICKDQCGDGQCQEVVCLSQGCPCLETEESCPQDCRTD